MRFGLFKQHKTKQPSNNKKRRFISSPTQKNANHFNSHSCQHKKAIKNYPSCLVQLDLVPLKSLTSVASRNLSVNDQLLRLKKQSQSFKLSCMKQNPWLPFHEILIDWFTGLLPPGKLAWPCWQPKKSPLEKEKHRPKPSMFCLPC